MKRVIAFILFILGTADYAYALCLVNYKPIDLDKIAKCLIGLVIISILLNIVFYLIKKDMRK